MISATTVLLTQPQLLHLSRSALFGSSHFGQVHFSGDGARARAFFGGAALGAGGAGSRSGRHALQPLQRSRPALLGSSHLLQSQRFEAASETGAAAGAAEGGRGASHVIQHTRSSSLFVSPHLPHFQRFSSASPFAPDSHCSCAFPSLPASPCICCCFEAGSSTITFKSNVNHKRHITTV